METKSYVGVTGFMSQTEVRSVLSCMPLDSNKLLMVGVLASQKTLDGEQNDQPNRYPKINDIGGIFLRSKRCLNLIHYHTKQQETLVEQLDELTALGGPYLDGFQLNMSWPSIQSIKEYKEKHWTSTIVLQIGQKAMEMVNDSPEELADRVVEYDGVVDYALLDLSGGNGYPLKTGFMGRCLQELKARNLDIGLGVAGGLSITTLNRVEPLLWTCPELSWAAEGRLRDKHDKLDVISAIQYVSRSCYLSSPTKIANCA